MKAPLAYWLLSLCFALPEKPVKMNRYVVSYLENNIELCNLYICGRDCVIKCLPAINFWCNELTAVFFLDHLRVG